MIKLIKNQSFPVKSLQFLYFLAMGSISPFLGLYFKKTISEPYDIKGIALVGFLFFIQPLVIIPTAPVLGYISDKYKMGHKLIFISTLMLFLSALLFYIPNTMDISFIGISIILTLAISLFGIFSGFLMPLIDSETLHFLHGKNGNASDYGKIRMWGSAGWIVSPIVVGWLAYKYNNLAISIIVFAIALLIMNLTSMNRSTYNKSQDKIDWGILKKDKTFIFFLIFTFVLNIATSSSFTFTSWFMDDNNASLMIIGLAFGLSALPEIPLMQNIAKIEKKLGNSNIISLGILIEGIRLFLFLIVAKTGRTELYIILLGLHGVFWTLYYNGIIQFIDKRPGQNLKTTRLSLMTFVTAGGAALGGPLGAFVVNKWSSFQLMKLDGFILIILSIIFYLSSRKKRVLNV